MNMLYHPTFPTADALTVNGNRDVTAPRWLVRQLRYVVYVRNFMTAQWVIKPFDCPVGWGCRIHRLLLCRGVRPPPNECPGYDTKQSDGEVPAVPELWGMRSTPSLPSLPGPL